MSSPSKVRNGACLLEPPGAFYDVRGAKMHLHEMGTRGGLPTVLIEGGNSMSGIAYARIQAALSPHLHVVTYDRAGLGWSDDIPGPRDADHLCEHLHLLLQQARIETPLVIAGHSIGGLLLRVYAGKYPSQVVGAVFLDATHPRSGELYPENDRVARAREFYRAQQASVTAGHLHESDECFIDCFDDLPQVQEQLRYAALQPRRYDVSIETVEAIDLSSQQAQSYGDLGDRPVLAITARTKVGSTFDDDRYNALWLDQHRDLALLSSRGRHLQMCAADHGTLISDARFASLVAEQVLRVAHEAAQTQ